MDWPTEVSNDSLRRKLHCPKINTLHEAYSLIVDKLDELWEQISLYPARHAPDKVHNELVQIAAICQRTASDLPPHVVGTCPTD